MAVDGGGWWRLVAVGGEYLRVVAGCGRWLWVVAVGSGWFDGWRVAAFGGISGEGCRVLAIHREQ